MSKTVGQNLNDYIVQKSNTFLLFNAGLHRHQFSTKSLNNIIYAKPSNNIYFNIAYLVLLEKKNTGFQCGIGLNTLTNNFYARELSSQKISFSTKYRDSHSSYKKIYLNFLYFLPNKKNIKLNFYLGPSAIFNSYLGEYQYIHDVAMTYEDTLVISYIKSWFTASKIKKISFSSQFGLTINYFTKNNLILNVSVGYRKGFTYFNLSNVKYDFNFLNKEFYFDTAEISTDGSGFYINVGFGFPFRI